MKEQSITSWIGDDLAVDVLFDYSPAEPAILYPNDKAHPGCEAEITINQVLVNNCDIFDCLNQATFNKIADEIQEYMTKD